ncbi:MAG: CoA transferase [Burkholderiales bacterium]|nr:CoA transferase [Burkholderiales bacterium]
MAEATITLGGAPTGPLTGIRVVDITINVVGPAASQILGDMGADVVKVEAPGGDGNRQTGPVRTPAMGVLYMNVNRNKRSIVLDLKRPECRDAAMRLIDSADVVMHSMRPAAIERLGLGYEAVRARNPRAIYAYAPGYRSDGPQRDRPAFDDVVQGESGMVDLMRRQQGQSRFFPMIMVDKFCGHVLASAITMALFERERSGQGQCVEVPMLETMLSFNLMEHLWGAALEAPRGTIGYPRPYMAERRPFPTRNGEICLMANSDDQWERLLQAVGLPELATDPRYRKLADRARHFPELYAAVAAKIALRTTEEWERVLDDIDIPNGRVRGLDDLIDDPYLVATGYFLRYRHPTEGEMRTTSIPVRFSRTPGNVRRHPPKLGEHTAEVLREAGLSAAEIAAVTGAGDA